MKKSLLAVLLPASLVLVVLFAVHINTAHALSSPTMSASPTTIGQGGSSYVSFSDPDGVCHETPVFDPADQGSDGGGATVSPTTTTTYSVTCNGKAASVTVTVNAAPQATASITASPSSIVSGSYSTLSWSSTNASSCTISGGSFYGGEAVAPSGTSSVNPSSYTTYSITCSGAGGTSGPSSTSINVTPQTTASLSANPSSITVGSNSALSWSSSNATSCTGTGFNTGGATSGTVSVAPSSSAQYSVTCSGSGGSQTASTIVNVGQPSPLSAMCSPAYGSATVGQSVPWYASASGGTMPYIYNWSGDDMSGPGYVYNGTSNSEQTPTYESAGTKSGAVSVTDSGASSGSPSSINWSSGYVCTGTRLGSGQSDVEDGGNAAGANAVAESNGQDTYSDPVDDSSAGWPADFQVNPQNYCVEGEVIEHCNPSQNSFGTGGCPFYIRETLYTGTGITPVTSADYNSYGFNGVNETGDYYQYFGTNLYTPAIGSTAQQRAGGACTATVAVSALTPTATISANPLSIISGQSSTISWSSTNTTSCSISGIGAVAVSGSTGVSPASTTTYNLSCTGSGGTATSAVTITVTPANHPPTGYLDQGTCTVISGWAYDPDTTSQSINVTNYIDSTPYTVLANGSRPDVQAAFGLPMANYGFSFNVPVSWSDGNTHTVTSYAIDSAGGPNTLIGQTTFNCPPALPNITAATGPVVNATAGQAVTLTGTASNTGTAAAGTFPTITQVCDGNCATINTVFSGSSVSSLAVNGSQAISSTYTPASAGTLYYRMCGNETPSGSSNFTPVITESNYADNCGAFQTLTVLPQLPPTPTGLTASCNAAGTAVSLSWTPTPGATGYYPRMYIPTAAQCTSYGWQVYSDGVTCIPNPDVPQTYTSFSNFPITPGQAYTTWVHAYNSAGLNPTPEYLNFSCSGLANLTATAGPVVSATAGQSTSFSGTVTNSGTGATTGGFWNLLQICSAAGPCTTYNTASNEVWANVLAAGGSTPISTNATVPSTAGSYSYRFCANNNTSWQNIVPESNYGDNCSSFQTLTVVSPTPSCSLSASPSTVTPGNSSTLTWSSTNTTSCVGSGFNTGNATNNSTSVTPALGSNSYGLTCTGSGGTCNALPVTVTDGCGGTAIPTIKATPNAIASGATSVISYAATSVNTSCVLTGPGIAQTAPANSCNVGTQNATTPALTSTSKYCVVCDGGAPKCVTVAIAPKFKEF